MSSQTEILRLELHDALQRESNLKKINESLMNAIAQQPEELENYSKEIQALKLKHIAQINDLKSISSVKEEELFRQIQQQRQKSHRLQQQLLQREQILKIFSLKLHQNQLSTRDHQRRTKQLQEVIHSQRVLINNARSNMEHHLILKQNLQETNRKEIEQDVSMKWKRILQEREVSKESELAGMRRSIDVLNARIKLLEKEKEYYARLEESREKEYYK